MMKQQQKGSVVVLVLGVISAIMIVCGMLGYSATQQMRTSEISREMLRARLIAESGLNKAYNSVKKNFAGISTYSDAASFGGGTYTVKLAEFRQDSGVQRARLVSEGVCGIGHSTVSIDLENRPTISSSITNTFYALAYDLLVGGQLYLNGDLRTQVNQIFANGNITVSGNSQFADATTIASAAAVIIKNAGKISGTYTTEENQPQQEIYPEALQAAINVLIAYAQMNGAVYASGADIPDSPPGGVAFCTGSSSGWSKTGTGTFIFLGDVSLQGAGVNITAQDGFPALVVLSASNVHLNAGTVIYGAIIMPNASLDINGHAEIHGVILVGQGVSGNGTADLYPWGGQGFNLPSLAATSDNVVITAWH